MSVGKPKPGNAELQLGHQLDVAEPELGVPRGWHSRGYLPHRDELHLLQSITFRLADSLPHSKLRQLDEILAILPTDKQANHKRQKIESWLDTGLGRCALRHPTVAARVQDALLHHDGERYRLMAWCIMPNHVHVLIHPLVPLAGIVQSWKSYTGRWAMARNAELELGVPRDQKSFWMRDYWDRFIRDEKHRNRVVTYIHENPVNAGLCRKPTAWPWSSARFRGLGTPSSSSASEK